MVPAEFAAGLSEPEYRLQLQRQAKQRQIDAMNANANAGPDLIMEIQALRKTTARYSEELHMQRDLINQLMEQVKRLEAITQPQEISRALGGLLHGKR